ncbi:MAG: hypothetical protein AAGA99_10535 [Actinomycetota bacterium]
MVGEPQPTTAGRGPGRPPTTDLDQIVAAGCDVGLEQLTLNAVAAHLDVHVATLYRYVAGRDELTQLVVDRIIDSVELPTDPALNDEELLVEFAVRLRRLLIDHPGLAGFSLTGGGSPAIDRHRAAACEVMVGRGHEATAGLLLFDETATYTVAWAYATDPTALPPRRPPSERGEVPAVLSEAERGYGRADEDRWFAWCVRAHVRGVLALIADDELPWS